jgi:hypothetical protein
MLMLYSGVVARVQKLVKDSRMFHISLASIIDEQLKRSHLAAMMNDNRC